MFTELFISERMDPFFMERMTYGWLLKSIVSPFYLICFGTEKRWIASRSWGFLQGDRNFWWEIEWMEELRRMKSEDPSDKPSLWESKTEQWAEESSGDRKQVIIASSENSLAKLLPGDSVVISVVITMKYQNYFVPCLNVSLAFLVYIIVWMGNMPSPLTWNLNGVLQRLM